MRAPRGFGRFLLLGLGLGKILMDRPLGQRVRTSGGFPPSIRKKHWLSARDLPYPYPAPPPWTPLAPLRKKQCYS